MSASRLVRPFASVVVLGLVLAGAARLASAQPSAAPPAPPPPGSSYYVPEPEPRHTGLYLHARLGLGYTHMRADDIDMTIAGGGGAFGLAIGMSVVPNLIVYAELFDNIATGPEVTQNGSTSTASDDTAAGVVGIGLGVRYYFMPSNFFVAGTLAASSLTVQENGEETAQSDTGLGVSLSAGKEWFVSTNWGLGVAAQLFLGSMPEGDNAGYDWSTSAFSINFSATYN